MDKQARLSAALAAIKETTAKKIESVNSALSAINSGELYFAKVHIEKAISADLLIEDLNIEANSLQSDIEAEAKEVI